MKIEQPRSIARRQRILDAALGVFSARGYRDASMDDIAAGADTSKGGVYFHFPNKQAVFLSLLDRTSAMLLDRAESAIEKETDPVLRLDAALTTVLRTFASYRSLARLFLVESMGAGPEFKPRMLQIHGRFEGVIQKHLDEAVEQGVVHDVDTALAARAWYGALNHIVTTWALTDDPEPLMDSYPALRKLLLRSVGLEKEQG